MGLFPSGFMAGCKEHVMEEARLKWRRFCCVLGLSLICLGAGACFVPQWLGTLENNKGHLQEMHQRNMELQQLQQDHPDMDMYRLEVEHRLKKVQGLLPDGPEAGRLMEVLQKQCDEHNVAMVEFAPKAVDSGDSGGKTEGLPSGLGELPVSLKLQGDYFAMQDFLVALPSCSRLLHVQSLSLEAKESGLLCSMELVGFYEK